MPSVLIGLMEMPDEGDLPSAARSSASIAVRPRACPPRTRCRRRGPRCSRGRSRDRRCRSVTGRRGTTCTGDARVQPELVTSATLTERNPVPIGVVIGPFSATRVRADRGERLPSGRRRAGRLHHVDTGVLHVPSERDAGRLEHAPWPPSLGPSAPGIRLTVRHGADGHARACESPIGAVRSRKEASHATREGNDERLQARAGGRRRRGDRDRRARPRGRRAPVTAASTSKTSSATTRTRTCGGCSSTTTSSR